MAKVFHYPWRAVVKEAHWRLPSPSGNVVSPELGAFVADNDGSFFELPGPTLREGTGQGRYLHNVYGQFLYSSEYSHQFQKESTDAPVRRTHFALTDAFIWLSGWLYRYREDVGHPFAERKLSEACVAFGDYLGNAKDFAPESLIVEIARNVPGAVASIVADPRKVLTREHTEVPLDKIQEMDGFSLVDLARRPGRTVAMKAGPKQRLMALTRRETADTIENRVVLDFIRRSARAARQYVDEMCARCPRRTVCRLHDPVTEEACPSERVKLVGGYARHCAAWLRGGAFAEVTRLAEPRTRPNYVLQQNIRYVKVWKHYLRLLRLEDVEEDVWRHLRIVWSDMVKMLFMMTWQAQLEPRAKLQTSRRPFMIRRHNRGGRWFVPSPCEDALVFGADKTYKTLYVLGPEEACKLTGDAHLRTLNADLVIVVAEGHGQFAVCPVWAFCPDVKCAAEDAAGRLAKAVADEIASACECGLCLYPAERNACAERGGVTCLGLNVFATDVSDVTKTLGDFILEVLS